MRRTHDQAVWAAWAYLKDRGHRVASEAGIIGGRIDIVRLDEKDNWVELYEIKLRNAGTGIGQLRGYGVRVGGDPALTLVVPPALADVDLIAAADSGGVRVWTFDFCWQPTLWDRPDMSVHLPYLHPSVSRRIGESNRRWAAAQRSAAA